MLASVLRSRIAVAASIQVVRAFVQLRGLVVTHTTLGRRLDELEQKYDRQFKAVFDALRELMAAPDPPRKRIGFQAVTLRRIEGIVAGNTTMTTAMKR